MDKRTFNKLLFMVFIGVILVISYLELNKSLQQIKIEYRINHTQENNMYGKERLKYYGIDNNSNQSIDAFIKLEDQNEHKSSMIFWKSIDSEDNYNNELQSYSKDNVNFEGEMIEIFSRKETQGDNMYTSGLVESTLAYKYGYFEFTIDISEGKGIFPAIWLLPNDGEGLPEIDIFEMIGSEPYTFYGVIHFIDNGIQDSDFYSHKVPVKEQYSVSLEWNEKSLTWYIDNQEMYATTQGVPKEYMYIIINQAIGGDWPGDPDNYTVFPNQFRILNTQIEPVFEKGRD